MRKIIVGSRQSTLALTQTNWVIEQFNKMEVPYEFEVKKIKTKGDRILDVTLSKVGGKGLFVKEIEQALFDEEIDMAVHSMKDMPAVLPDGLIIGCIPEREDSRDVLISKNEVKLDDLPQGAIIGTSSLRRSAQLLAYRPDLEIKWIRGNIETRLNKLKNEDYDAIILAAAGLSRMGWSRDFVTEFLDPSICVPAVGQGALAIECREDDKEVLELLQKLNDEFVTKTITAERAFLHKMEGGCQVPIAGHAVLNENNEVSLTALVGTPDGTVILKDTFVGTDPVEVGEQAAEGLSKRGARDIIEKVKAELNE